MRIQLDRLSAETVTELVRAVFPMLPSAADVGAHLHRRTGGNALFVRELLAEAARRGVFPTDLQELPETVQQSIDSRLAQLSPHTLRYLHAAAVAGERFSADLVARVAGLAEADTEAAMAEALRLRFVRTVGGAGDTLAFDHALVREALVNRLILTQRRRLHREVAEALLSAGGRLDVEAVAFHLGQARDARAVAYLLELGDRDLRQGMLRSAQAAYERALDLLPDGDARRPEILLKTGQSVRYGDFSAALSYWAEAAREAPERPAAVWSRTQRLAFYMDANEADLRSLVARAEQLLSDPEYQRLERDLYGCLAGYPRCIGQFVEFFLGAGRIAEAEQLVDEMERRTAPGSNPYPVINFRVRLAGLHGRSQEYLDLLRQMAAAQYQTRYYRNVVGWEAELLRAMLIYRADRPAEVDAQARRVLEIQAEAQERSGYTHWSGLSPLGEYQFWRGDWEGARQNMVAVVRRSARGWFSMRRTAAALLVAEGDLTGALEVLAPMSPVSPVQAPGITVNHDEVATLCARARVHMRLGDLNQASACLKAAGRWLAWLRVVPQLPLFHLARAEYCLRTGDREGARQEALEGLRWAEGLPDLPRQIEASRVLGQLAASGGRVDEAERYFRIALDVADRCQFPYEVALTELARAEAMLPGAVASLSQACETFARLGAAADRQRAEAALHVQPQEVAFSEREFDVLRLVARGLTDKEVAAALFISPRTVDGHLRRMFRKAGVGSRTALATYAARHGLDR
ncbi:MAG TPA: LuxR C-terminal-related transcriptional regulator [Symbiobacteriaceae bacterium]|nr:LuxR C-terminal-related transcriptional regulator [Symbiobacteriaceae bacterium]